MSDTSGDRRAFLLRTGALLGGTLIGGASIARSERGLPEPRSESEEDVSPAEDLMREHGILKRILLMYNEAATRLAAEKKDISPGVIAAAAEIIRTFIEDYHEKLEEDHLFPRFERAGKLVDLVSVLRLQHQRGRVLTALILNEATATTISDPAGRRRLADHLIRFSRMYDPHEAREDTILFPAFRTIISPHEYGSLGEAFERKERQLFGEDGFERYVNRVEELEKSMGIYDLSLFTPDVK